MPTERPRRPAYLDPNALAALGGRHDPSHEVEIAHESARVLVRAGRTAHDPETTRRFVALVDELGLDTVADLWAARPATSLPGALWRLYAIREWVREDPLSASREYTAGMRFADVQHAVAGPAEPPGPRELSDLVDAILSGIFDGDLAVALERAAAFCRVVAAGRADLGDGDQHAQRASGLLATGEDLARCASLWRTGQLD